MVLSYNVIKVILRRMNGLWVIMVMFSANAAMDFETLEVATDTLGQVSVYAPHTVIETRLEGDELFGFMLNSVVQVQTPDFLIARGICAPYTVIRYRGSPAVVSSPCGDEEWAYLVSASKVQFLPLKRFEAVRYDFATSALYTLSDEVISKHALDHYNLESVWVGANISDFYVSSGNLFYIRSGTEFRRSNDGQTVKIGLAPSGRHHKYYIPKSSASRLAIAASILPLFILQRLVAF